MENSPPLQAEHELDPAPLYWLYWHQLQVVEPGEEVLVPWGQGEQSILPG